MAETHPIAISSGENTLEGLAYLPDQVPAPAAVVVCHPHPLYGGDMYNHVVVTLCQILAARGLAALSFNFRSAGGGDASKQMGGERDDVLAALAAASTLPIAHDAPMGLAGYSFGALMAAEVANAGGVAALALISPPAARPNAPELISAGIPTLIVCGSEDPVATSSELDSLTRDVGEGCELLVLRGEDHFWASGFQAAADMIVAWFQKTLSLSLPVDAEAGR